MSGLFAQPAAEPADPQALADAKRAAAAATTAAAATKRDFKPVYPPSPVIARLVFDDARWQDEVSIGFPVIVDPVAGSIPDVKHPSYGRAETNFDVWDGSLGLARVVGGKRDDRGENIAGGVDALHPAPFTGKSEGVLALGNTLYLWRDGDASSVEYFKFAELRRSDDHGATWRECGVRFSKSGGDFPEGDAGIFAPAFCQFDKGYAGARDSFIYIYAPGSIDPRHWNVRVPGRINLLRVAGTQIETKGEHEFFAGVDAQGQPQWGKRTGERKPVWQDAVQGTHRIAVSYNPGLKRYLLTTITLDRSGWMSVYDAAEPWGPWTHVQTEHNPERWGTLTIIFTFVNKWLSADGREFTIVHTKNDRWATIEGRFELK